MSWHGRLREAVRAGTAFRPFDYASAGPGLARLDSNESPFPPDDEEMRAYREELERLALNRYPGIDGAPLREALARRWGVAPEEILIGNGSEEIISILILAFCAGLGAEAKVLHPDPTFNQYEALARAYGADPLGVPLDPGFRLDEARCADAIDRARPALAFFASPNNPTGNRFDADALCRLARRLDSAFIVDEAYADFGGGSLIPRLPATPGLFVMRSLSKIGLAGLRLGALVGPREALAELDKARLPWNVNAVSIALACATLRCPERLERRIRATVALRGSLERELKSLPDLIVYPSDANFLLVRTPFDADAVFEALLAHGVLVKNVSAPGLLAGCLRITVGTASENERCVRALAGAGTANAPGPSPH